MGMTQADIDAAVREAQALTSIDLARIQRSFANLAERNKRLDHQRCLSLSQLQEPFTI